MTGVLISEQRHKEKVKGAINKEESRLVVPSPIVLRVY